MGAEDAWYQSGVALPFLEERKPRPARIRRTLRIADEVQAYLDFIGEKIVPYARFVGVPGLDLPTPPPKPEPLDWLEKRERWGFPNPGTFLDQPMEWMEDLEGARIGRARHVNEQRAKTVGQDTMAGAPKLEMM